MRRTGLIADCDIGSEFARFLGYLRAYVLVAYRILMPRVYYCRISYLPLPVDGAGKPVPVSADSPPLILPDLKDPVPSDWVTETGHYNLVYAINIPQLDPGKEVFPLYQYTCL